ncbi:MAG TPA: EDR1-related protein [Verrucomicrobiales bacterium]|nr:EDR1-related protein [Verrucomicrobiales bacterium]
MNGKILAILVATILPVAGEVFIPGAGKTEWRYLTGGTAAKNWQNGDFDDAAWSAGKGPVGFGERGLGTEIKHAAGNKPVTAWFRHHFEAAPEMAGEKALILTLRAQDGAVVYLNGKEIARVNLPADAGAETPATANTDGDSRKLSIKGAPLQKGSNILAVEVHQAAAKSDGLVLDASLRTDDMRPAGSATLTESAREATMAYYTKHYIAPEMKVPDGYVDGGRRMVVGKNAVVISGREILVIDRTKDAALRKQLAYAKDPELLKLPTAERAKKLAQYVDKVLSPGGDRRAAMQAVEEFTTEYANRPVLFGEMEEACQSGVCRHRALLFKMLCDDAGLKSALVRGNYSDGRSGGGHAWNELILDDGARVIVDVMNPRPDFQFLPETAPEAKHYITVKNEGIYPRKPEGKP